MLSYFALLLRSTVPCRAPGSAKQRRPGFAAHFHSVSLLKGEARSKSPIFISPEAKAVSLDFHEMILFLKPPHNFVLQHLKYSAAYGWGTSRWKPLHARTLRGFLQRFLGTGFAASRCARAFAFLLCLRGVARARTGTRCVHSVNSVAFVCALHPLMKLHLNIVVPLLEH